MNIISAMGRNTHKTTIANLTPTIDSNVFFGTLTMHFYVFDHHGYLLAQSADFLSAQRAYDDWVATSGGHALEHAMEHGHVHIDGQKYVHVVDYDLDNQMVHPEEVVKGLLRITGDNVNREGLHETPRRVVKAWAKWTEGYSVDIPALLKVFEDGAENYDQMVVVKDIPIYSKCEHHLADIFGTCTIAYIPNGKVVGLSKLSRLADAFARRLQVQERLTSQIADALVEHLAPLGVGVVIKARHMCMESRGICQQGHHTVTSALHGKLKDDPQARAEFLALAQ